MDTPLIENTLVMNIGDMMEDPVQWQIPGHQTPGEKGL